MKAVDEALSVRRKYRGSRKAQDRGLTAAQRRHSPTAAPSALSIQVDAALAIGSQATPGVATDVQIELPAPGILQTDPPAHTFDFADWESDHSDHFLYDQLSEEHRTDHTAHSGIQTDPPVVDAPATGPAGDDAPGTGTTSDDAHGTAPAATDAPPAAPIPLGQEGNWMPGGPRLSTLTPSYVTHVAALLWRETRDAAGVTEPDVFDPAVVFPGRPSPAVRK